MQSIRQVARLNEAELEKVVPPNASWHTDYRDTAYIYIGGLSFDLSEGDVLAIFSQYGNPVHINLVRDKETGKSRGFCFLKYEDQRSCDLAVDNLSGASVLGKLLSVDHTRYKKREGEIEGEGLDDDEQDGDETEREDDGESRRKRRRTSESGSEHEEERPRAKEEIELARLRRDMDDDDPMKAYMVKEKEEEVAEALRAIALNKDKAIDRVRKHKSRHHVSKKDKDDRDSVRKSNGHRSKRDENAYDDSGRQRRHDRSRRKERSPLSGSEQYPSYRRDRKTRERSHSPYRRGRANDVDSDCEAKKTTSGKR